MGTQSPMMRGTTSRPTLPGRPRNTPTTPAATAHALELHGSTDAEFYFDMEGQVIEERHGYDRVTATKMSGASTTSTTCSCATTRASAPEPTISTTPTSTSPRRRTTAASCRQRFVYGPCGQQTALSSSWAVSGSNSIYGYQGGRYDVATGMNHFGMRDYYPSLGVWLQKDPVRIRRRRERSAAQLLVSDPLTAVDPTGMWERPLPFSQSHVVIANEGDTIETLLPRLLGDTPLPGNMIRDGIGFDPLGGNGAYFGYSNGPFKEGEGVNISPILQYLQAMIRQNTIDAAHQFNALFFGGQNPLAYPAGRVHEFFGGADPRHAARLLFLDAANNG